MQDEQTWYHSPTPTKAFSTCITSNTKRAILMDAHVFRRLCDVLCPLLHHARLEKVYSPAKDVTVFTFYAQKRKQHLVFKAGRQNPFCYISKERPVALAQPSALIMRYRKYCAGRHIVSCSADWIQRKIFLLFHTHSASIADTEAIPPETWLVLDMREGIQLVLGRSPHTSPSPHENHWPDAQYIDDALENWRQWPIMTPALRRTLPHLDVLDKQALLMDLQAGGGDVFLYTSDKNTELYAWPLPPALIHGRQERTLEDPLEATSLIGDDIVLGKAAEQLRNQAALPHEREITRLTKLLQKLELEEERLNNMQALHEHALRIQGILWQFPPDTKLPHIDIETMDETTQKTQRITLDPRLTLRDNMQAFFHQAGRGKRGLDFLQKRRDTLEQQRAMTQDRAHALHAGAGTPTAPAASHTHKEQRATLHQPTLPRGVQAFCSSDGFIIWRGKDAKGNGAVLRGAHAQDLWLHVEGGPGSHCIIRRHFSGQDIPTRTLHEAASLAAVKSWQKDSPHADIVCAYVKHVKPMRNAATGMVRIDKVVNSFRLTIESDVENKLQPPHSHHAKSREQK